MKRHDQTVALYHQILKNASMGEGTTKHLLKTNRGNALSDALHTQNAMYAAISKEAENSLIERGIKVSGLSKAERIRTDVGLSMSLLMNNTDSHVAEMLITGSAMGIVNAERELNNHPEAEDKARTLMKHLSDFERGTIDKMKGFL